MSASDYTVRALQPSDDAEVLALLTASLAGGPTGERTQAFFDWKHRDNPAGASPGLVAVTADGSLAAVRLFLRWDLALGDRPLKAVRAVDTATHPEHQGKGLFRRLTLEALETVAADADLVFNTPNGQSLPGYLKMGWQQVGELPVRLRPVRPVRFLRGIRSSGQAPVTAVAEPVSSTLVTVPSLLAARGEEMDALLARYEQAAAAERLRTPRTPAYLRWRYGDAPGLDYRAVVVDDASGLRALGVGRLRRRGALVELTLSEVLHAPGDLGGARRVLTGATRAGVDHVALLVEGGSPLVRTSTVAGYLPVPGRGLTLVVNPRVTLPLDATRPDAWALGLGDLELF